MRSVTNTLTFLLSILVLLLCIGIPTVDHIHVSDTAFDEVCHIVESEPICETTTSSCCETTNEVTTHTSKLGSECNCNLIASCCCCFFELKLLPFSFDIPLNYTKLIPDFIQAYSINLNPFNLLVNEPQHSLNRFDLPPLIPYSQQLSVFQVFRL